MGVLWSWLGSEATGRAAEVRLLAPSPDERKQKPAPTSRVHQGTTLGARGVRLSSRSRKIAAGVLVAATLVVAGGFVLWRYLRGGPVEDRLDLVGAETQAFVTFLAVPEDRPLVDLIESLKRRPAGAGGEKRAEWLRSLSDPLSGMLMQRVRASALVETSGDGR